MEAVMNRTGELLTVRYVHETSKISIRQLYRLMDAGHLERRRVGTRSIRITAESYFRYIDRLNAAPGITTADVSRAGAAGSAADQPSFTAADVPSFAS